MYDKAKKKKIRPDRFVRYAVARNIIKSPPGPHIGALLTWRWPGAGKGIDDRA